MQLPDGWTEHDGGPCPVPSGAVVDLLFRDGTIMPGQCAGVWGQDSDGGLSNWTHQEDDADDDIIAYKPEHPNVG